MADERGTEEIRREIAGERDQLADAVTDLRRDVRSVAGRIPTVVGGAVAAVAALVVGRAAVRRKRGRD